MYRDEEQGERLQRQVLQFLVKGKAQAALISTAASTLADMLWEQKKYEEAEATLVQACQVRAKACLVFSVRLCTDCLLLTQNECNIDMSCHTHAVLPHCRNWRCWCTALHCAHAGTKATAVHLFVCLVLLCAQDQYHKPFHHLLLTV